MKKPGRLSLAALVALMSAIALASAGLATPSERSLKLSLALTGVSSEEASSLDREIIAAAKAAASPSASSGQRPLLRLRHRPLPAAPVRQPPPSEEPKRVVAEPAAPQAAKPEPARTAAPRVARPAPVAVPAPAAPAPTPIPAVPDLSGSLIEDAHRVLDRSAPLLRAPKDPPIREMRRLYVKPGMQRPPPGPPPGGRGGRKGGPDPRRKAPGPGAGPGPGPGGPHGPGGPPPPPPPDGPGPLR